MDDKIMIREAAAKVGGVLALCRALGTSHATVSAWKRVPPKWVIPVEKATGVRRETLRPDLYPPEDRAA